tara:strand:- start:408 stop:599 length:192 start_codon:yes stop_codon:yes gene_type:complete
VLTLMVMLVVSVAASCVADGPSCRGSGWCAGAAGEHAAGERRAGDTGGGPFGDASSWGSGLGV